ncbi:MAG: adenylate/guanylate cyclase domain-containing protein [Bacteroidota bacterium]
MYKTILPLVFLLIGLSLSQASPIILQEEKEVKITSNFFYVQDSTKIYTYPEILDQDFTLAHDSSYHKEVGVYWLKFTLTNQHPVQRDWILNLEGWSYVDLYTQKEGQLLHQKTGHLHPYSKRDFPVANYNYLRVEVPQDSSLECILRLESTFNLLKAPKDLTFKLGSLAYINEEAESESRVIYFFLGVFVIIFLFHLFVYFSTRLKSYLWYLAWVALLIHSTAHNSGYLIEMFGWMDSFPTTIIYPEIIIGALSIYITIMFLMEFLKVRDRYPKWVRAVNIILIFTLVGTIWQFIDYEAGYGFLFLVFLSMVVVNISLAIKSLRDGYPGSLFFLIGYSVAISSVVVYAFASVEAIPMNNLTFKYSQAIGGAIEAVLFSFALANLINVLQKENEEKQANIIRQLEENRELEGKVMRELEAKVKERTAEIQEQKNQIEEQAEALAHEKEKADNLLLNILPEETAIELKETGVAKPRYYEEVSIMFTDFKGFTNIVSHISPEFLVTELDDIFKQFDDIMEEVGLEKIQTIGDAYVAACGLPTPDPEHAFKCIKAAQRIIAYLEQRNQEASIDWLVRIGIHTGPITAGVIGKKKFSYDLFGDTINVAARFETNSEAGKINISSSTYELVKDQVNCTYRGKINAKGKGEVDMYFVDPVERVK